MSEVLRGRLDELVAATAGFLIEEIGHTRSFSLDTDKSLSERAESIRGFHRLPRPRAAGGPEYDDARS